MSKKQEYSRARNWTKARIKGFFISNTLLSEKERALLKDIYLLKEELLKDWDKNSKELLDNIKND